MLAKPKTTGPGKIVPFRRRKQKRLPRRPLEAVPADWKRWDTAAKAVGLNWSEFTRRALNLYSIYGERAALLAEATAVVVPARKRTGIIAGALAAMDPERVARLSEKGVPKRGAKNGTKVKGSTAGRKG